MLTSLARPRRVRARPYPHAHRRRQKPRQGRRKAHGATPFPDTSTAERSRQTARAERYASTTAASLAASNCMMPRSAGDLTATRRAISPNSLRLPISLPQRSGSSTTNVAELWSHTARAEPRPWTCAATLSPLSPGCDRRAAVSLIAADIAIVKDEYSSATIVKLLRTGPQCRRSCAGLSQLFLPHRSKPFAGAKGLPAEQTSSGGLPSCRPGLPASPTLCP